MREKWKSVMEVVTFEWYLGNEIGVNLDVWGEVVKRTKDGTQVSGLSSWVDGYGIPFVEK